MALSYVHTPGNYQNRYETIPERLHHIAGKCEDKEVYVFLHLDGKRDSITAPELYRKARNLGHSLVKLGIKEGDIVATCMYNELDLLVCTFGIIFAGAVVLNLAIKNTDGRDLKKTFNELDVRCLILNPDEDNKQLDACLTFIENIRKTGSIDCQSVPRLQFFISTRQVKGRELLLLSDLTEEQSHAAFKLPRLDPESTVVLFPTSGSTGESKFAQHSHHNVLLTGPILKDSIGYDENDIIYNERRIQWIGGFPFMLLHDGVTVVTKTKAFTSLNEHCEFTYNAIKNESCSIACLLPPTIMGLFEIVHEMSRPAEFMLKNIHVGGLPIASVIMNAIGVISEMVTNVYGSSEMGFCTTNPVRNKAEYIDYCIGKPSPDIEVKVVDDDGFLVEREVTGNLRVRCPGMFSGYYKNEEKTKEVLPPNRWMDTDDIGYVTKDGKIIAKGRKSDIIMQCGRYHYASEYEAFIKTHPDVMDVIVVAVPDPVCFELVCACVIPFPGKVLTADDVEEFYTSQVFTFSGEAFSRDKPAHFMIFESFPTVYTGKPDKKALKQIVITRLQKN